MIALNTILELDILESERKDFSKAIHQALDSLDWLKRIAKESVIAKDFEITAYLLMDLLRKTNGHVSELKKVIEDETEKAVIGV